MTATDRAALERWNFDTWSPACRAWFDGERLGDKLRFTASLIVVDREVEPADARTTLLSVGELYAPDGETLLLPLWPRSRGAQLLAREGTAVLSFVANGTFHQARLRVGYARLTSGIEFELDEQRAAVLAHWTRQIEQIRLIAAALPR
ncbi:MAG: hypothetical protein VB143_05540 [Burkholderia sp.]